MKKLFSIRYSDNATSFGLLILRLAVGGLMIPHGYNKLLNYSARSASFADPFHIGNELSMALSIFAEFFCGILVLIGFMTRLACIPLIINMAVALFVAHKGGLLNEGEKSALFLAGYLVLLFTGPGKISMDRFVGK